MNLFKKWLHTTFFTSRKDCNILTVRQVNGHVFCNDNYGYLQTQWRTPLQLKTANAWGCDLSNSQLVILKVIASTILAKPDETNVYHTFLRMTWFTDRWKIFNPPSLCSMSFHGVCNSAKLCFHNKILSTLTTLNSKEGVEKDKFGTLKKCSFGKMSKHFCPRL